MYYNTDIVYFMCLCFLYTLYTIFYFIARTIYVLYMGTSLQATDIPKAKLYTVYHIRPMAHGHLLTRFAL